VSTRTGEGSGGRRRHLLGHSWPPPLRALKEKGARAGRHGGVRPSVAWTSSREKEELEKREARSRITGFGPVAGAGGSPAAAAPPDSDRERGEMALGFGATRPDAGF